MKKVVLKVGVHNDKEKQKAMRAVSSLSGIESMSMDMKEQKLTVIGDVDPVQIVGKLKKSWHTNILTVGPKEAEKKKEEPKKEEPKKEEPKKDEKEQIAELVKAYKAYNPCMTQYYQVHSIEENPNACVIS